MLLSSHLKLISPRFDSKSPFFNSFSRRFIVFFSILFLTHSFPLHVNYSIAFVSQWLQQRRSVLELFHPQRFNCLCPSERMYILQWAWVLDEESCESFWLFNVCYIRHERTSVSAGVAALWLHSQLGLWCRTRLRIWKNGNFSRS